MQSYQMIWSGRGDRAEYNELKETLAAATADVK